MPRLSIYKHFEGVFWIVNSTDLVVSLTDRSSFRKGVDKTTYGAFVDIDPCHEKISLRTLVLPISSSCSFCSVSLRFAFHLLASNLQVDHSIVESFGGKGKTCITSRVYPTLAVDNNARLYAFNNGTQTVVISSLKVWNMSNAQIK